MAAVVLYRDILHLFERYPPYGHWRIKLDVIDWLIENNIDFKEISVVLDISKWHTSPRFGLEFQRPEDVMAFRLAWL